MNTPSSSNFARGALALSGLILLAVGLSVVRDPLAYQADLGVLLPDDPTLLSDLRAMGGSLLGFAVLLFAGASSSRLGPSAALAGAVLFSSYGLARVASMIVDGLPATALIGAAAIELVVGLTLGVLASRGVRS